eukprot:scaffold76175_cov93-Phaeocystis_antarctica.AAC.1
MTTSAAASSTCAGQRRQIKWWLPSSGTSTAPWPWARTSATTRPRPHRGRPRGATRTRPTSPPSTRVRSAGSWRRASVRDGYGDRLRPRGAR